mmetsp:Transcript_52574/g.112126  ORF Transcript_52574/g.112126 Transcript_52574/m.112126 type:complete len:206 (+) Transcript_52574:650-1267(+)
MPRNANTHARQVPALWATSPFITTVRFRGGVELTPFMQTRASSDSPSWGEFSQSFRELSQSSCTSLGAELIAASNVWRFFPLCSSSRPSLIASRMMPKSPVSTDGSTRSDRRKEAAASFAACSRGTSKKSAIFSSSLRTSLGSNDPRRVASKIPTDSGLLIASSAQFRPCCQKSPNHLKLPEATIRMKSTRVHSMLLLRLPVWKS